MSNPTNGSSASGLNLPRILQVGTRPKVERGRHRLAPQPSSASVLLGLAVFVFATALFRLWNALTNWDDVPDVSLEELGAVRSQFVTLTQELATLGSERAR